MKVLFITNIPVPYRVDFYNELGKMVELTVVFEAKGASDQGIRFNYNLNEIKNFKAVFLSEGDIKEKRINRKIFKYIDKDYDAIVLTSYSYYTEMALLLYLKLIRRPYYLSSDGGIIKYGESKLKYLYKKMLISGAKGYFSPSEKTDEYLLYYGAKKENLHRYPFTSFKKEEQLKAIVPYSEKITIRERLGIHRKYMIIGVGQFIYRKGWDILIKASADFIDDVCICIIGGKTDGVYEEIQKKCGTKAEIRYLEFMEKDELNMYYRAADLFVLPTREDIWGLVINEAMNYGLPIITTDACVAGRELVRNNENGYLITAEDSDDALMHFSECVNKILSDENMRTEFSKCSRKIIADYSIENMAAEYDKALRKE